MARPALSEEQIEDFRVRAAAVAMELFVKQGYEQFSLRTLARELGCSHATPYRYFKDKAEIFALVRADGFRRFAAFLQARLARCEGAEEGLHALAHGYFDFAQQQSAAFTVIFEMGQPSAATYPFVDEAGFASWSVLRSAVGAAIDEGVVVGDSELLAHVMWAGIHGVASLQLAGKMTVGRRAEEVVDAMVTALIRAHRPTADAPARASQIVRKAEKKHD